MNRPRNDDSADEERRKRSKTIPVPSKSYGSVDVQHHERSRRTIPVPDKPYGSVDERHHERRTIPVPNKPYGSVDVQHHERWRRTIELTAEGKSSVQCCFTSTETVRTIRDGIEPRTATSDFHTAPELCPCITGSRFNVALRPQRPYGLLATGSPGQTPRHSHSP